MTGLSQKTEQKLTVALVALHAKNLPFAKEIELAKKACSAAVVEALANTNWKEKQEV